MVLMSSISMLTAEFCVGGMSHASTGGQSVNV